MLFQGHIWICEATSDIRTPLLLNVTASPHQAAAGVCRLSFHILSGSPAGLLVHVLATKLCSCAAVHLILFALVVIVD